MHTRKQSVNVWVNPSSQQTIPMTSYRFGSWHVAISRQPMAKVELASQYDAVSRNWKQMTRRYGLVAAYRRPLLASGAAAALGKLGSQVSVLDCGIGSGALAIALSSILPNTHNICGIDLSREMLASAEVEMRRAGIAPELRQADVLSIPYADASFDFVMAAHVLEHLPEPLCAMKEMVRVLKPGGILFVCLTRRSVFGALIQLRWRTWAITEMQGVDWFQACGLEDIDFQSIRLASYAGRASTAFWARRPNASEATPASTSQETGS